MSTKYATPLVLEPAASRSLRNWLVLIHLVAVIQLPFIPLPVWVCIFITGLILFSLWQSIWHHPDSVCAVLWHEARACQLSLRSGECIDARLVPQVFILPWLVIMHFKGSRMRHYHMVLLPGMLEPGAFRRVRVRLMLELNQATD